MTEGVSWAAFAADAPQLAAAIAGRFAAHRHHILGTIRPGGAPRLSGTEVRIDGDVTVGMMLGSQKLADAQRDPRVELHSVPLEEDLAEGDAALAGELEPIAPPPDEPAGSFFRLAITLARLVRVADDELVVASWRPERGVRDIRRT